MQGNAEKILPDHNAPRPSEAFRQTKDLNKVACFLAYASSYIVKNFHDVGPDGKSKDVFPVIIAQALAAGVDTPEFYDSFEAGERYSKLDLTNMANGKFYPNKNQRARIIHNLRESARYELGHETSQQKRIAEATCKTETERVQQLSKAPWARSKRQDMTHCQMN